MPDNGAENFAEIVRRHALSKPDERAFVFLGRHGEVADERSYAQLDAGARRLASAMTHRGLGGAPVLLIYPSGLEFIEALFGCFYAGCIAVPAPYMMPKRAGERIAAICRDCRPAAVLTLSRPEGDAGMRGAMLREFSGLDFIFTDTLDAHSEPWSPPVVGPGDLALLQYTSGSTSEPKGVMLSHGNLIANSSMIREAMGHGADLRGVGWLPLFHDMGLIGHVIQPVHVGALSVLMSPLLFLQRPWTWLKAISDWKATTSGGPNYAFDLCTKSVSSEKAKTLDLSSWSVAYCGSEPVRPEVLERFAERFEASGFRRDAIYPCYGLAEATLMVTGPRNGTGMRSVSRAVIATGGQVANAAPGPFASCGQPVPGESLAIVDPESGRPAAGGAIGEIWVKGPNVGLGYWGRPEESEIIFRARTTSGETGWLRTGDLGFVERGDLFIVGRMKDMIIIRGMNHAPADIEASVGASHTTFSGLATAAFGIDDTGEEQVVVVQEIKPPVYNRDEPKIAAEAAFEHVTRDHGLRLYDLVLVRAGAIPRTSSGKVRRHRCREMYQAGEFERLNATADLEFLGINLYRTAENLAG